MMNSNFNKFPYIELTQRHGSFSGWKEIAAELKKKIISFNKKKIVLAVECYHGVFEEVLSKEINSSIIFAHSISARNLFKSQDEISDMIQSCLTDDPVFGVLSDFAIKDFYDELKLKEAKEKISNIEKGIIFIYGTGASLITEPDILIYADMARWEIQQRFRKNEISNLGMDNKEIPHQLKYKQAFFVDWRVCDKLKKELFDKWDYFLDTNKPAIPKMTTGEAIRTAMKEAVNQPFEVVPYFDPGPWGGQWMKEICGLNREAPNFAWCFNCVPEENSLLIKINEITFEMPSINLVLYKPAELLGEKVYKRFGAEFPIRFDFLDTMGGRQSQPSGSSINRVYKRRVWMGIYSG